MKIKSLILLSLLYIILPLGLNSQEVAINVVTTTDIHASYFPVFENDTRNYRGSLAQLKTFLDINAFNNLILLDNGDLLQGHPAGYYLNFVNYGDIHFAARAMNEMGFAGTIAGNHDIEMGPEIYERLKAEFNFPYLAANILHIKSGEPHFVPYTIIDKEGVKVAVLGLTTPAIPRWLPRKLWEGLEFEPMLTSAQKWMTHIQGKEKPDVIIGLFHSGLGEDHPYSDTINPENASLYVAKHVKGFDIIFTGHDHRERNMEIVNNFGEKVHITGASPHLRSVAVATITLKTDTPDHYEIMSIETSTPSLTDLPPDESFTKSYDKEIREIKSYLNKDIGTLSTTITSQNSFFGSAAFTDFVHEIQMELTGADLSFAAPLAFNSTIEKGDLTMADMFRLYPFENYLYKMELSGKEIKDYLEFSYGLWFNTMESSDDHLLLFEERDSNNDRIWLENPSYNFDSAAGLDYTVDVSKKPGNRITIHGFSDGKSFSEDEKYLVAINSYRGSGGGDHLTRGAGIDDDLLESRIRWVSEKDLRGHIADYIQDKGTLTPLPLDNWTIEPEEWVQKSKIRDKNLLFGDD